MIYISSEDLTLISEGPLAKVYKYGKPFCDGINSAVVKISPMLNPKTAIEKYNLIRHTGCSHLAFYEECRVDGKPAIIMEDLYTDDKIYVSPNSYGRKNCKPEQELTQSPLNGIANVESVLLQLRDMANCCSGNGIGLDMDMISFGFDRGDECPNVLCKFVDTDALLQDDSCRYKLREPNIISAKEAFQKFVNCFVKPEAQAALLKAEDGFDW